MPRRIRTNRYAVNFHNRDLLHFHPFPTSPMTPPKHAWTHPIAYSAQQEYARWPSPRSGSVLGPCSPFCSSCIPALPSLTFSYGFGLSDPAGSSAWTVSDSFHLCIRSAPGCSRRCAAYYGQTVSRTRRLPSISVSPALISAGAFIPHIKTAGPYVFPVQHKHGTLY